MWIQIQTLEQNGTLTKSESLYMGVEIQTKSAGSWGTQKELISHNRTEEAKQDERL